MPDTGRPTPAAAVVDHTETPPTAGVKRPSTGLYTSDAMFKRPPVASTDAAGAER